MIPTLTLADYSIAARCPGCGEMLPPSARVETYPSAHSEWIVAECPKCLILTPFRLEER